MGHIMMTKVRGKGRAPKGTKRVAIYLRVSTSEQTTAIQRRELQVVAKRQGWSAVQVFERCRHIRRQGSEQAASAGRDA
jgi:DNA invertase Pin-like site-specific DNA recombinase